VVDKAHIFSAGARTKASKGPQGNPTRGTTHTQRMRRVDRWLLGTRSSLLRHGPVRVVDLGFGASPVTTVELFTRLRGLNPGVLVSGLEIDQDRVALAAAAAVEGLDFRLGGFELPVATPPVVVRAFNVLRQYREEDVVDVWKLLVAGLAPGGILVEGTCDEVGRHACWVTVTAAGPVSLTLSTRLAGLERPSDLAERLPKALIHRNVPGERIHAFLETLDAAWARAAVVAPFGLRQRWRAMCADVSAQSWRLLGDDHRWRLGEVSVAWDDVAPQGWDASAPWGRPQERTDRRDQVDLCS
jgi:hypothetical protein